MTEVAVLAAARYEFHEGFRWYRERSARAAKRFALGVKSAITAIREHPEQHPRWSDEYRFCVVSGFPYYIAYRHDAVKVVIVAIRHAAQDQEAWQGR